jgi:hypothetical protein
MPRMCWILCLGAFLVWAPWAAASEPQSPACDCPCRANYHAQPAYPFFPGCCEPRRNCFDNAWDGYCDKRARWDAFWCKVGTGAFCSCTACPTRDGRGAAWAARVHPATAACGCQGPPTTIPAAER